MSYTQVVDDYFIEHRAKLLDIAAFLDRTDRAHSQPSTEDFRMQALRECIRILTDNDGNRTCRILERLSDHSTTPLTSALDLKGAYGAPTPPD